MAAIRMLGTYEVLCGVTILLRRWVGRWRVLPVLAVVGFVGWDAWRFLQGDTPDCGCLGGIQLASAWWHVLVKQVIVTGLTAAYLAGLDVRREASDSGVTLSRGPI